MDTDKKDCYNCIYYDTREDSCFNETWCKTHCRFDDLPEKDCEYFSPRKKCKHRFEECYQNCSIICRRMPSETGCEYWFKCDLDDYGCDEECEKHQKRHELEEKRTILSKLYYSKSLIEELIDRYTQDIETLKKELNHD